MNIYHSYVETSGFKFSCIGISDDNWPDGVDECEKKVLCKEYIIPEIAGTNSN